MKITALVVLAALWGCTASYAMDDQPAQSISASVNIQTEAAKSKMEGDQYLAKNKNAPGVTTLPDGLQYKILKKGTGAMPSASDTVTVDYEGRFINGEVFDSSYKRNKPTSFEVGGVIAGWTEALQLMPVGSTWEITVPASLAYGSDGMPPAIGPNKTLIFKVDLQKINKP